MVTSLLLCMSMLVVNMWVCESEETDVTCGNGTLKVSLLGTKNVNGYWDVSYKIDRKFCRLSNRWRLDLEQNATLNNGSQYLQLKGVLTEDIPESELNGSLAINLRKEDGLLKGSQRIVVANGAVTDEMLETQLHQTRQEDEECNESLSEDDRYNVDTEPITEIRGEDDDFSALIDPRMGITEENEQIHFPKEKKCKKKVNSKFTKRKDDYTVITNSPDSETSTINSIPVEKEVLIDKGEEDGCTGDYGSYHIEPKTGSQENHDKVYFPQERKCNKSMPSKTIDEAGSQHKPSDDNVIDQIQLIPEGNRSADFNEVKTCSGHEATVGSPLKIVSRLDWKANETNVPFKSFERPVKFVYVTQTDVICPEKEGCNPILRNMQAVLKECFGDVYSNFYVADGGRVYEGLGWNRVRSPDSLYFHFLSDGWRLPSTQTMASFGLLLWEGVRIGKMSEEYVLVENRHLTKSFLRELKKWVDWSKDMWGGKQTNSPT